MARSKKVSLDELMNVPSVQSNSNKWEGTPVADLSVGDSFTHKGRRFKIESKVECPMQWRTHVHINKSNCFDGRCLVETV